MPSNPFKIFVVEDNEWYNKLLVHTLSLNPDYEIKSFLNAKSLLTSLNENPDVVSLDYGLPDMRGEEVLKKIKEYNSNIGVVIVSEQSEIETAIELLKAGAFDYIVKANDIKDKLLNAVSNIRNNLMLKKQVKILQKEVQKKYDFERSIIGNSSSIKDIYELMSKAVSTNITVTISGETGTGKELVAKAIHYNSKLKEHPFIPVNLAAIPSELTESELFGHEKGSFTGATYRRIGKFEEAGSGTIFLDEIAEMDLNTQAKLLRVLQEKEITRIGSNTPIKVNCRIIVASNKNLKEEVKNGRFREDLYYRILGLPIHLPPLRDRGNDILMLAKFFMDNFCNENEIAIKTLSDKAKKKLLNYQWPGNVRELKSIIELSVVLCNDDIININDITLSEAQDLSQMLTEEHSMREYERLIVDAFMKKYNNDTKLVANKLGIGQTTVYRILKEMSENEHAN